jgi:adenosylcobinamide-GDP ribazoletransferase
LADGLPWFPLVGAALGLLGAGCAWAMMSFAPSPWLEATAFALLVLNALATRGLHLDGVADWADGFWGGRTKERVLQIMKDPAVGAFGIVALILVLLGKWVALCALLHGAYPGVLVLTPTLSRCVQVDLAVWLPYARQEGGTGQGFVAGARPWHRLLALALGAAVATAAVGPAYGLGSPALALLLGRALGWWFRRRVGGVTGDLLGAANEIIETALLLVWAVLA